MMFVESRVRVILLGGVLLHVFIGLGFTPETNLGTKRTLSEQAAFFGFLLGK